MDGNDSEEEEEEEEETTGGALEFHYDSLVSLVDTFTCTCVYIHDVYMCVMYTCTLHQGLGLATHNL